MLPVKVADIFGNVRALLNDNDAAIFTNSVILPYFQMAYDDMRLAAENYNIPFTNETSGTITLPSGSLTLGSDGNPSLPQDLVEILSISERPSGTTNDFLLMERRQFLPQTEVHTSYLGLWSWQGQVVHFIGATGDIDIKLNYIADKFGQLIDENTLITYYNCRNYLQYRTAALCALYIGENSARAETLNMEAALVVDMLINQGLKTQQAIITRRRPFNARAKARGWGW